MRLTLEPKLIPKGMGIAVLSVILLTLTWVASISLQGRDIREPDAPTQQMRQSLVRVALLGEFYAAWLKSVSVKVLMAQGLLN